MLERGNFLLVEGGTDSDREVARGIQHEAPALGTRLQAACPGGLYPLGSKSIFTAHGCDIKTLTSPGLTNQAGQYRLYKKQSADIKISEAHRIYLLTRDMATISALFVVLF